MRWPWQRRPDPPPEDEVNGSVAEIRRFAEQARERARRDTVRVEREAPRIARLPDDEFVARVSRLFRPT